MSSPTRRLFWLLVCSAFGLGVCFSGVFFTGNQVWFLALPVALLAGWFVFADPTKCLPQSRNK